MNRLLVIAISILLLSCKNGSSEINKELDARSLPASVSKAFFDKYPTATGITWKETKENNEQTFQAKFTFQNTEMKTEFDANGVIIKQKGTD